MLFALGEATAAESAENLVRCIRADAPQGLLDQFAGAEAVRSAR